MKQTSSTSLRTYYWTMQRGRLPRLRRLRGRPSFRVGNAGDLFNRDLIRWAYPGVSVDNTANEGRRLLLVGSIAHTARAGDVLNGVGCKRADLPPSIDLPLTIRGVRGPLSVDALVAAGHDTSGLRFLGDPGLLIGKVFPDAVSTPAESNRQIFLPHYRERTSFPSHVRGVPVVDIDAEPEDVAREIARAERIHTSSLHGLIWAHAIGREACLVQPMTEESEFKYRDYLSSVSAELRWSTDIESSLRSAPLRVGNDLDRMIDEISLPSLEELTEDGIHG